MRIPGNPVKAALAVGLAGWMAAMAGPAAADPLKCQEAIAKASAKYVQARSKALQKCEEGKVTGKLPAGSTLCTIEPKAAAAIAKARTAFKAAIDKACGGADKVCGTGGDDVAVASIGWTPGVQCPSFQLGGCPDTDPDCGCQRVISHCGDVADCIECTDQRATDQAVGLMYDRFNQAPFGTKNAVNKCQAAIGKEQQKFFAAKSKILGKCWAARLKGKHANPCPNPGDGKAAAAIVKAETKLRTALCKACGGADKLCGGGDDLAIPDLFVSTLGCRALQVPDGGPSCGAIGVLNTVGKVVDCVACVTEFNVDCVDRIAVEGVSDYPAECNGSSAPVCGNGLTEAGESCDDGNLVDGDTCPSTCVIESCTPNYSSTRTVRIAFTGPSALAGAVFFLDYPEGKIILPGSSGDAEAFITSLRGGFVAANDFDYGVRVGIAGYSPTGSGNIMDLEFTNCSGAPAPVVGDFSCTVEQAGDDIGNDIPLSSVTCSVTILP